MLELLKTRFCSTWCPKLAPEIQIDNNKGGKVWFDDVKIIKGNSAKTTIIQENNFYSFGLKHRGYNNIVSSNGNSTAQKFGYNGKELSEELGINWHDFDARNYDASLGRWMNIDPLAEFTMSHSPYAYAFNNPIYFDDPTGMLPGIDPGKLNDIVNYIDDLQTVAEYKDAIQLDEVTITSSTSSASKSRARGLTIWGFGYDTSGRTGTTTHGINAEDFADVTRFTKTTNAIGEWLRKLFEALNFSNEANKLANKDKDEDEDKKTTMDKKVEEESKNVPEKIKENTIKLVLIKVRKVQYVYPSQHDGTLTTNDVLISKDTVINRSDSSEVVRGNKSRNKKIRQKAIQKYKKSLN